MIRLKTGTGPALAGAALAFWATLDERTRQVMPWDAPDPGKELYACLACSGLVALGYDEGKPRALAFTQGRGATCQVHFTMARGLDNATRLWFGFAFLKEAIQKYACLLCVIPLPYRGARAYVSLLDFKSLAILPGACFIARHKRFVDGELFSYGAR